jgi:ABC-type multidrug transport system ATPase subunit
VSPVLQLRDVGKSYGRHVVLRSVDLTVEPGTVLGVVGGNGSGKSTLLRIIAGLSRPSAGRVIGNPSVGYLPDRFPAAQRLSGRSYLRHLAAIHGLTDPAHVDRLIDRLDLVGGPDTPMRDLSKGNAQKLGLAQVVLGDPELVVFDEPWSGLDAAAHQLLADLIAETRTAGRTVVFADHRRAAVEQIADRVVEAVDGELRDLDRTRSTRPETPPPRAPLADAPPAGAPPPGTIRIAHAGADPAELATIAGVLRVRAAVDDGAPNLVLAVDPARSDEVLAVALGRGCSVRGVRPW